MIEKKKANNLLKTIKEIIKKEENYVNINDIFYVKLAKIDRAIQEFEEHEGVQI